MCLLDASGRLLKPLRRLIGKLVSAVVKKGRGERREETPFSLLFPFAKEKFKACFSFFLCSPKGCEGEGKKGIVGVSDFRQTGGKGKAGRCKVFEIQKVRIV